MIRRRAGLLAAALLLASACHAPVASSPKKATSTAGAKASPTAVSSAEAALNKLQAPPGDFARVSGTIQVDASYVVAQGVGILSDHGGGLVSNNGGSILLAGAGIISDHGGGLVSNNSGNVVATADGNIVSDQGGSLITGQGGSLIGNNAGNLISNNGGGLIGKVKYRLADAAPAVAYGQQLPAAAMRLFAIDPDTGAFLPLGVDAHGKAVYAIYTNLSGGYQVYLPAGQKDLVRVIAVVPDQTDARLGYNVFAKPGQTDVLLDEDVASATQYVRLGISEKFKNLLVLDQLANNGGLPSDDILDKTFGRANALPGLRDLLRDKLKQVFTAVAANPRITTKDYAAVASAMADLLIARQGDLDTIDLDPSYFGGAAAEVAGKPYTTGHSLDALRGILAELRTRVSGLAKSPDEAEAYFAGKPYLTSANRFHARLNPADPSPYYRIRKAADLADFMAREYFSLVPDVPYGCAAGDCPGTPAADCNVVDGCIPDAGIGKLNNDEIFALPKGVLRDVGLPEYYGSVVNAVGQSVMFGVGGLLGDDANLADVVKLIHDYNAPAATATP